MKTKTKRTTAMTITLKHTKRAKQNRAAQQAQAPQPAESISEKAVLVVLSIRRWQGIKRDKATAKALADSMKANEKSLLLDKQIVSKAFLKRLSVIISRARELNKDLTLPWTDDGIRVLPIKKYSKYRDGVIKDGQVIQEGMNHLQAQYEDALEKMLDAYDAEKQAMKAELLGLGMMWREEDYPTRDQLKAKHGWSLRIMPLPSSMDFRVKLGQEAEDRLKKELQSQLSLVEKKAAKDLARRIATHVERIIERLSSDKIRINDSLTGSLKDMMEDLDDLNVFEDGRVDALIKRLQPLADTDPQALRDSELARVGTKQVAKDLMVDLTKFMA